MATIRAISMRLKSVKNIQKITKSMKMVSAAKYARAERELKMARSLGEKTEKMYSQDKTESSSDDKKGSLIFVAVSSDRGLCGAIHTSVARHIRTSAKNRSDLLKIVCIGDKARTILQRQFAQQILFACSEVGRLPPTFLDACRIANEILLSDYEFDEGKIVFNRFRSVVSYVTSEMPIYRLHAANKLGVFEKFEDTDEETLTCFVEFSMANLLFYAMKESACSEQSARMTAMDNASKNASEMIDKLTLTFNRTRQAAITRELIEIISGASAL